ncbi:uncharacterized protein LOC141614179 [Silene latifolia]|uniref:uncharacterized protein LOC141614179 n=1 Tax=Silene latifolia TaxID=37657 RepID=UPI003D773DC7
MATEEKTRLNFARVMIELQVNQKLPDMVKFKDELGQLIKIEVEYEWKPVTCDFCKGVGHEAKDCRWKKQGDKKKETKVVRKEWRPIAGKAVEKVPELGNDTSGEAPEIQENTTKDGGVSPLSRVSCSAKGEQGTVKRLVILGRQDAREEGYSDSNFGAHSYTEVVQRSGTVQQQQGVSGSEETKIKPCNFNKVANSFSTSWSISTNSRFHKGGRIWVLWQPAKFQIQFLEYDAQFIHMKVESLLSKESFYLTYIYAFNGIHERTPLWSKLRRIATTMRGPWAMGGDFNYVLAHSERCGGHTSQAEIDDFRSCVIDCGMLDIQAIGSLYTWNNKQRPEDRT